MIQKGKKLLLYLAVLAAIFKFLFHRLRLISVHGIKNSFSDSLQKLRRVSKWTPKGLVDSSLATGTPLKIISGWNSLLFFTENIISTPFLVMSGLNSIFHWYAHLPTVAKPFSYFLLSMLNILNFGWTNAFQI